MIWYFYLIIPDTYISFLSAWGGASPCISPYYSGPFPDSFSGKAPIHHQMYAAWALSGILIDLVHLVTNE